MKCQGVGSTGRFSSHIFLSPAPGMTQRHPMDIPGTGRCSWLCSCEGRAVWKPHPSIPTVGNVRKDQ